MIDTMESSLREAQAHKSLRRVAHPDIHRGMLGNVRVVGDGWDISHNYP